MNSNTKLEIPYIAGLFDADGSAQYKQYMKKRGKDKKAYPTWDIRLEISMTDQNVIELVHETLMVGTVRPKKVPKGMKPQWRWRCTFRDCLSVCKLLWPHTVVKLHDIEKVINHYEPDLQELGDNLVDLEMEREKRNV